MKVLTYIREALRDFYPSSELRDMTLAVWCDLLGGDALDVYLDKDINLSSSKSQDLENILVRLRKNEPLQYIGGKALFRGRSFHVEPGVLIPRPETAELVGWIVDNHAEPHLRVLDIGTGSGCIAISLDKELKEAEVTAWDISTEALSIARLNSEKLGSTVNFILQNVLTWGKKDNQLPFDIIVSNPPYVTEKEKKDMDRNVLDWEPSLALFVPDNDPLLFYRKIADVGLSLLKSGGALYFEINQLYGADTVEMLQHMGYHDVFVKKDFFNNDRFIIARR